MISMNYLILLRPKQWIKNLMMFFPSFLTGSLFSSSSMSVTGLLAFTSFCCVSSALYIFNDLNDIERDVLHPVKRLRPLPSGVISKLNAAAGALLLGLLSLAVALLFVTPMVPYLLLYAAVTIAYTLWLKNIPVVDLFCISCGFIVRLQSGGATFNVEISEWLFLSVFFLSLFLSSGKRLSEQALLGSDAAGHRTSLCGYPQGTLDAVLLVTAATVLVTYSMYTLVHPHLVYTVPLCTFGLFRYILRVKSGNSGDPTESLLRDAPLLCVSIVWAMLVGWSIYL
ncbi:MAG: decaprenyl-phosphate phosphoribosyltransferase [Geobacteraceae bacterium]|nr:decaprenyl-phosphate phosphoribosyltransferase [Geobacteraceae bacterium]NTW79442.1 decaprenyl-phosphate phosphoribosyltransferase [Geobacteraceae bacterium]